MATIDPACSRLADRGRVVKARGGSRDRNGLAIEGGAYRGKTVGSTVVDIDADRRDATSDRRREQEEKEIKERSTTSIAAGVVVDDFEMVGDDRETILTESPEAFNRRLSSQLTGCCYTYSSYSASSMCSAYKQNCAGGGGGGSHDSGDQSCEQKGLSFIGVSFSVNTANGNPYSYQLCDQFPMENIIDRNYNYVMSMDEDGWLVGGGYKSFDYSGKMP